MSTNPFPGKRSVSHSEISLYRECQQRHSYRYVQELVPKRIERPLHIGTWVHALLEYHYAGKPWREKHAEFVAHYDRLLDSEKLRMDKGKSKKKSEDRADYEPLPSQVERIMLSYLWYNRAEKIKTLGVEVHFWLDMGDYVLHGVIDHIYEDADGLIWIRDHKVWDDLPDENAFHTMDPQLTIYLRGAKEALGVEAAGVEYNYVRSTAPSFPELTTKGKISESAVATDYPTLFRWYKANGFDPREYTNTLAPLYRVSPFLRRYRMPRIDVVTDRIFKDLSKTAGEILRGEDPVRNIGRQCSWCPYQAICRNELFGLNTRAQRRRDFMTKQEVKEMEAKRRKVTT